MNRQTKRKKSLGFWALIFLPALFLGLLALLKVLIPTPSIQTFQGVNQLIPDLTLTRLDHTPVTLSSFKKKLLIIHFWATWCEACMEEMPSLSRFRDEHEKLGLEVLGVNLDDHPEAVLSDVASFNLHFPILTDSDGKVADYFGVRGVPMTIILDEQRKVLLVKEGQENWQSPLVRRQIGYWLNP